MQRSAPNTGRNIAARMGRWSASHRTTAIFGWLAFVLAAIVIGTAVGQRTIDMQNENVGQAGRADQILKQGGFRESDPLNEIVVIQTSTLTHAGSVPASASRALAWSPGLPTNHSPTV